MIYINPRATEPQASARSTRDNFPHLFADNGQLLRNIFIYFDNTHKNIIVETIYSDTNEIKKALAEFIQTEKAKAQKDFNDAQIRLQTIASATARRAK